MHKPLALAAALITSALSAVAVPPAHAATAQFDWGVHDAVEGSPLQVLAAGSSFQEQYAFLLQSPGVIDATLTALNIFGGQVNLFPAGGSSVPAVQFPIVSGGGPSFGSGSLESGAYYYLVSGSVPAGGGFGAYSLTSRFSPTPVPEPSTWAMLLVGTLCVAGAMRRHARS